MEHLILSRRNLLILLSKLDRVRAGGESNCTIIKYDPEVMVTAREDEVVYDTRIAGVMHPIDEANIE